MNFAIKIGCDRVEITIIPFFLVASPHVVQLKRLCHEDIVLLY